MPGPKPVWVLGNMYARVRACVSMAEFDQELYERHGGRRVCGYFEFTKPCLMVGDLLLLKHIMVKDFDHFTDRRYVGVYVCVCVCVCCCCCFIYLFF